MLYVKTNATVSAKNSGTLRESALSETQLLISSDSTTYHVGVRAWDHALHEIRRALITVGAFI